MKSFFLRLSLASVLVVALGLAAAIAVSAMPAIGSRLAGTPKKPASQVDNTGRSCDTFGDQLLGDAVKSGDLTQAEANKIRAEVRGPGGCQALVALKAHLGHGNEVVTETLLTNGLDAVASALRISPADLKSQIAAGKSLHAIADSKGLSKDQFKADTTANLKQRLDASVATGAITQADEEKALANVDNLIERFWDKDRSSGQPNSKVPTKTPVAAP